MGRVKEVVRSIACLPRESRTRCKRTHKLLLSAVDHGGAPWGKLSMLNRHLACELRLSQRAAHSRTWHVGRHPELRRLEPTRGELRCEERTRGTGAYATKHWLADRIDKLHQTLVRKEG